MLGLRVHSIRGVLQRQGVDLTQTLTFGELSAQLHRRTRDAHTSFCEYLQTTADADAIHPATLYVSVTLQQGVEDVLETLAEDAAVADTVVWLDVWSCNSHDTSRTFEQWRQFMELAIRSVPRMLVLLSPCHAPTAWRHAWELYDIHCAMRAKKDLVFGMLVSERPAFLQTLHDNPISVVHNMVASIALDECEAVNEHDRQGVLAAIRDQMPALRTYIIRTLCAYLQRAIAQDDCDEALRAQTLGLVYLTEEAEADAETHLLQSFDAWQQRHPSPHLSTLRCQHWLAVAYLSSTDADKKQRGCELMQTCVRDLETLLGDDRSNGVLISTKMHWAHALLAQGKVREAEPWILQCYHACDDTHPYYPIIQLLLGFLYEQNGNNDLAMPLFLSSYQRLTTRHGPNHLDTMTALMRLVDQYYMHKQFDSAERLLLDCDRRQQWMFGKYHHIRIYTLTRLAYVYDRQQQWPLAKIYYGRCVALCDRLRGRNHETTLSFLFALALVYERTEHYATAKRLYQRCYQGRAASLGEEHADTLTAMLGMADMHVALEEDDQAFPWLQQCLAGRRKLLGETHPDTLEVLESLANCRAVSPWTPPVDELTKRSEQLVLTPL